METFAQWLARRDNSLQERNFLKKATTGLLLAYQALTGGDPAQAATQLGVKVPQHVKSVSDTNAEAEAAETEKQKRQLANKSAKLMKKR